MARRYLAQEIEVVSDEDREVSRKGRFVYADEVPALQGSREETAPFPDRHQSDRIDAVREEGDEELVKLGGASKIAVERLERTLGVEDHPEGTERVRRVKYGSMRMKESTTRRLSATPSR